jgi:hypothetical protein
VSVATLDEIGIDASLPLASGIRSAGPSASRALTPRPTETRPFVYDPRHTRGARTASGNQGPWRRVAKERKEMGMTHVASMGHEAALVAVDTEASASITLEGQSQTPRKHTSIRTC